LVEQSATSITWKVWRQASDRVLRAPEHSRGAHWILLLKVTQALAKPRRIKLIDWKDSHATLGASRAAHQPVAALSGRVRQCSVDDLHELAIA
jgi:hypothetical protein